MKRTGIEKSIVQQIMKRKLKELDYNVHKNTTLYKAKTLLHANTVGCSVTDLNKFRIGKD